MISTYAHDTQPKLSMAFYEGHAYAVLLCEEGEEIRYVDVTSLYRTVHKYLMT